MVIYFLSSGSTGCLLNPLGCIPGGSDALKAVGESVKTTAETLTTAVTSAATIQKQSMGTITTALTDVTKNPVAAGGNIGLNVGATLTGSAIACGSNRNRGTKSGEPEGTACSWLSDGKLCYLHTRNGVWKCDESCANSKACCKKWWKDGVCTNTG